MSTGKGERSSDYGDLADYVQRGRVLISMAEGRTEKGEIENVAGVSASTAHRILDGFIKDGLVERTEPGEYRLTATGEAVTDEVRDFRDRVDTVKDLAPVTESARDEGVEFDPSVFEDAVVTTPTVEKPYEPARRFVEVFRETDELRLLVVSTATPMFSEEKQRLIAGGKETEVVCPESIVEASVETVPRDIAEGLVENLTLRVHDDPPFSVALFDDSVGVGGHGEDGRLKVFADTDDEDAYEWGERVYERYRGESDGLFERFDAEDLLERVGFDPEQAWVGGP